MKQAIFYIVIAIALVGLILNLDAFLFSFVRMAISLAIFAGIIYLIYYFFFLTEDQRKYKRAQRKYRKRLKK
ncbi:SA1362 family protein [Staphylococcus ureilyticus]|uniref:SA1362 family protein n=1 Tax=Staphylococcus ureilyticus TaxID=94138 RepID=UPI0021577365|nr:SA1362 family protein [Staphylococcus ureilyticus]MDV3051448.1 SA1362 family protein [Staphylococcus ureilyticus]